MTDAEKPAHDIVPEERVATFLRNYHYGSDIEKQFSAMLLSIIRIAVLEEREANARIANEISGYAAGKIRARTTCETDTLRQGSPG